MLVKSTCKRSIGSSGHNLVKRCFVQIALMLQAMHAKDLMDCCISDMAMPGHQKCSCSKDKVWS